jgi:hypothetical protein
MMRRSVGVGALEMLDRDARADHVLPLLGFFFEDVLGWRSMISPVASTCFLMSAAAI